MVSFQITPLLRRPQGPQGCLEKRNCPLSSNLAVWCAKIGPKTQKLQKTVKKPSFFVVFLVISEVFQKLWLLGPILVHQSTKFEISEWFCFSRYPCGPCGRQNSGMKPKSADSVSVPRLQSTFWFMQLSSQWHFCPFFIYTKKFQFNMRYIKRLLTFEIIRSNHVM